MAKQDLKQRKTHVNEINKCVIYGLRKNVYKMSNQDVKSKSKKT